MTRMKTLCTALFAVFALAAAFSATQALALELPDVHVLSGETYPATGEGSLKGKEIGILETEIGEKLTSETVGVSAELTELSSLGPGALVFTNVVEPKSGSKCNTAGDPEGTVKLSGEYHVVVIKEVPLTPAILILFKELTVTCGSLKIKVRSPAVIALNGVTSGTDVTSYKLASKCSGKGKQELREYLNDEGKATKAQLTANFGLGFETACETVKEELTVTSSKMIDFLF